MGLLNVFYVSSGQIKVLIPYLCDLIKGFLVDFTKEEIKRVADTESSSLL